MFDLLIANIQNKDTALTINICPSKTNNGRKYAIPDDGNIEHRTIFKKYLSLRQADRIVFLQTVFIKYKNENVSNKILAFVLVECIQHSLRGQIYRTCIYMDIFATTNHDFKY